MNHLSLFDHLDIYQANLLAKVLFFENVCVIIYKAVFRNYVTLLIAIISFVNN